MLDKALIDRVKDSTDIVEVIGRVVNLKKQGKSFVGLCPFHKERTPSFSVSRSRGSFHCFGCGEGGGVIDFLMKYQHVRFPDAVRMLAHEVGIPLDDPAAGRGKAAALPKMPVADPARLAALKSMKEEAPSVAFTAHQRLQMHKSNALAQAFFSANLTDPSRDFAKEADAAKDYLLQTRQLTWSVIERFGLGLAPSVNSTALFDCMPAPLKAAAVRAGLVCAYKPGMDGKGSKETIDPLALDASAFARAESFVDRFRARVTFPIRDASGRIVGFAGRTVPPSKRVVPKYLNTAATAIFHKSALLYGLFEARQAIARAGFVLIVEGYLDVIALAQAGVQNVVASMGTACTREQIEQLFRVSGELIFCFDGDSAGKKAMDRAKELCLDLVDDEHKARFLFLPSGEDPDTYVRRVGRGAFEEEIFNASRSAIPM